MKKYIFALATLVCISNVRNIALAYISDYDQQLCLLTRSCTTGFLTAASGSPFATGAAPYEVVYSPNGAFAAATNQSDNTISVYTVNQTTGTFTQVTGSPYAVGTQPISLAYSPDSNFLAVSNQTSSTVDIFSVQAGTGQLTPIAGSPFPAISGSYWLTYCPDGQFLAVTGLGVGFGVAVYTINTSTGAITGSVAGSPFATGSTPIAAAYSPNGQFFAVSNNGAPSISVYTVNTATGVLTAVAGSPFASASPGGLSFSPSSEFLAVPNIGANTVSIYAVNQITGVITPIAGSPFATGGTNPFAVAYSPDTNFAAISHFGTTIAMYSVNNLTGAFTAVTGSPFATGIQSRSLMFNPTSNFLAVSNQSNNRISVYSLFNSPITLSPTTLPDGTLDLTYNQLITASGGQAPYTFSLAAGTLPTGITLNASGLLSGTPTVTGVFNVTIMATDHTNCVSNQAYTLTIVSSCNAPVLSTATANCNQTISITGNSAQPGATVTILSDGISTGTTIADSSGNFSATTQALTPGQHIITVTQSFGSCISEQSNALTITVPTAIMLSAIPSCGNPVL